MRKSVINVLAAIALFVVSAVSGFAQVKQYSNDLSTFYGLTVCNDFEVTVVSGSSFNVLLTVDEAYKDYVTCNITNQMLTIAVDSKKVPKEVKNLFKGKGSQVPTFKATVTTPESIDQICLQDNAVLYYTIEKANTNEVKVTADGHSVIKQLSIGAPKAVLSLDRHANCVIDSYCDEVEVSMSGNAALTLNAKQASNLSLNLGKGASIVTNSESQTVTVAADGTSKAALNGTAVSAKFSVKGAAGVNASNLAIEEATVNMNSLCNLSVAPAAKLNIESLSAGATLNYNGDPTVSIGSIVKSTVNRTK